MEKTSPKPLFNDTRRLAIEERAVRIADDGACFLFKEAAQSIGERLEVTNREFHLATDLFSPFSCMNDILSEAKNVDRHIQVTSPAYGSCKDASFSNVEPVFSNRENLPLTSESINLATSVFGLHWSNDLTGSLVQICRALKPDGLFLAALPGDRTLAEMRDCLITAEAEISGNATMRIEPFGEIRQYGSLLQRAGFSLPVVDADLLTVRYGSFDAIIRDLRAMGAVSCLQNAEYYASRKMFARAAEIYQEKYSDADGKLRVTVEIVYLTGWKPHHSQQKPLKPGSAKSNLADFFSKETK